MVSLAACGTSPSAMDAPSSPAPSGGGSAVAYRAEAGANADAGVDDATTPSAGAHALKDNRDRLIDTLAKRKTKERCALWSALSATQKGVFLTISDLLGKRSFLTTGPETAL